jgi:RNA polymerase sigma factor (sigma-70 family)
MEEDLPSQRDSYARFPSTVWTLIREVQASPTREGRAALGRLLAQYWRPIYAYYRSRRVCCEDAEDLTQGFLESVVANKAILRVDSAAGSFRDWLAVCARNFMLDRQRRAAARKRAPSGGLLSIDRLKALYGAPFEPPKHYDPQTALRDAWRRDILDRALSTVAEECRRTQRETDYRVFADYYLHEETVQPTWSQVAHRHRLRDWREASRKADWVKGRLARAIRDEIRLYVDSEEEVDAEIQELYR